MVAHINASDAQAWVESTKLPITSLDTNLEAQVSADILGQLMQTYGAFVPLWVDATTTPQIVRQVIAMFYTSWIYDRSYSEVEVDGARTSYGATLRQWAQNLLTGIINGSIAIAEIAPNAPAVAPDFYPNDASSTRQAALANWCDTSLGPAKFSMGMKF
jgi:hypothetical protein